MKALFAAALVAVCAVPALAMEESAMKSDHATMVCRPAGAHETANAAMTSGTKLVCKSVADVMMKKKPGPEIGGLTPSQIDAAWRAYFEKMMSIGP